MEEQIILVLNKYEFGLIVNALNELRTDLQKENKDREPVNELLLRLLNKIEKKNKQDRRQLLEEQIILVLNKYEFGLIVNALNELRTDLQKENKDREPVNELLLRLLNTPVKKKSIFKRERIISER